ncbi:MAG: hypothetical protein OHK0029_12440 [Armatimonadaceae bacterium]
MWYDMRFGHKTLWGDREFIPSLSRFTVETIPAWDARNLLVNRGTLLIINDALRERGSLSEGDRRTLIRHAVKAIIGYGDSLLYFFGQYHWSYRQKMERVAADTRIPVEFRRLYARAGAFRLRPNYPEWLEHDPVEFAAGLRDALAPIHLQVEQLRLHRPNLNWETYAEAAFAATLNHDWNLRSTAKRALYLIRGNGVSVGASGLSPVAQIGLRTGGPREMLAILFPQVAYDLACPPYRHLTAPLFCTAKAREQMPCGEPICGSGVSMEISTLPRCCKSSGFRWKEAPQNELIPNIPPADLPDR